MCNILKNDCFFTNITIFLINNPRNVENTYIAFVQLAQMIYTGISVYNSLGIRHLFSPFAVQNNGIFCAVNL